jgi:DNA-binding GntR family transcriptional regulator
MPENENAIEFGRDFTEAITEVAHNAMLIGIHRADQENARLRDKRAARMSPWFWFLAGVVSTCVLQSLG